MANGMQTTTIPKLRQVFYTTYAAFPTTGVATGDIAYATDRLALYRWSGAAWQPVTIFTGSGVAANIPAIATMPEGSLYYETDTGILKQAQAGAWVEISLATPGEGHINIFALAYNSVGQGTWAFGADASWFQMYGYMSTQANGDNVTFKAFLAAGTYTVKVYSGRSSDSGIMKIQFNGVEKKSIDQYSAGALNWGWIDSFSVVVAASGIVDIKCLANGKHASSTAYQINVKLIVLWRTA